MVYIQFNQMIIIFIEMENVMREMYLTICNNMQPFANGACVKHHNLYYGHGVVNITSWSFFFI